MEFENIKTSLIPYDQNEIETLMQQLLLQNGVTDILYPGSNISQISAVVSYVISTLNVNTSANLQETILPLATKRMNVLMGARQLGYEPANIKSYRYKITIKPSYDASVKITDPNSPDFGNIDLQDQTHPRDIFIERNTKFQNGDKTYYYIGPRIVIKNITNYDITYINDVNTGKLKSKMTAEIEVIEGILNTPETDPILSMTAVDYHKDGTPKVRQDYLVPYHNLDDKDGIRVFLSYVDQNGYNKFKEEWSQAEQFIFDDSLNYNKLKFLRMRNIILGMPAIFFEFAGFGNGIRSKTQIDVEVLQSSGAGGEAKGKFSTEGTTNFGIFEVPNYTLIQKGVSEESNEEIKENAIVFHNTGNRAVTRNDYITLAKKLPLVREADAWGGEDETPQVIGNIWLSCTPANTERPINKLVHSPDAQDPSSWEKFIIDTGTTSLDPSDKFQKNWRNWYLIDEEYEGFQDKKTNIISRGVFPFLETFKIMTMRLNYRHPLYVDFHYDVQIVKYDMHRSIQETNKLVFDTIDHYFKTKIETFDSEYLNSNLQRVLDTVLDYKAGVNFELNLRGVLARRMIDKYTRYKTVDTKGKPTGDNKIIVQLAYPFENIIPKGIQEPLNSDVLPVIDTKVFGQKNQALWCNYKDLEAKTQIGSVRKIPIHYGGTLPAPGTPGTGGQVIGEYRVDLRKNIIEMEFDFKQNTTLIDDIFGVTNPGVSLDQYAEFDISYYPYDTNLVNVPFTKNIMPRLKSVNFHY